MAFRGLARCSILFIIVFLMCPKRSRLGAPIGKKYSVIRSQKDVINGAVQKFRPAHWSSSSNIIRQGNDEGVMGADEEPGFDLSEDEIKKFKLWPMGVIPYYIDVPSFNDKVLRDRIRLLLNEINALTKISFQELPSPPKEEDTRWVFFANRRGQLGCADHSIMNFTNEGVQHVLLGYDCVSMGRELAEAVLAIAGVPPQHNSPDRDEYIEVLCDNIIPEKKYLFEKLDNDEWLFHDLKYDFASGGHYNSHKYSANGRATINILPKYSGTAIGETKGLSMSDVKKLKMLYNYIAKNQETALPECDKLFKKGDTFKKMETSKVQPRKKPNRYLGLPDDHHSEEKNDAEDYSNERNDSDYAHKLSFSSSDGDYQGNAARGSDPPLEQLKLMVKVDPLLHLSDYSDSRRRKLKKKTTKRE